MTSTLIPSGAIGGGGEVVHLLIEGDNSVALPLVAADVGRADIVYLDPPYDTGKTDWMYGDARGDWVDFMRARLLLVSSMLAEGGVVAASIGYQRVHHLALLMAEVFPQHQVHTITVEVSGGKPGGGVKRVEEYLLLALPDGFTPHPMPWVQAGSEARQPWEGLTLSTAAKGRWPNQVYPIIVDRSTRRVVDVGASLQDLLDAGEEFDPYTYPLTQDDVREEETVALWPVTRHGKECSWRLSRAAFVAALGRGHVKVDPTHMPGNPNPFSVKYLPAGAAKRIDAGEIEVLGFDANGALILRSAVPVSAEIPTIWSRKEHHTAKGTARLTALIGRHHFPYPKPVPLIRDILTALAGDRPRAVILDPFAGSGTTLEAVAELNATDGGERRAILITNDEGGVHELVTLPRVRAVAAEHALSVELLTAR
ncbi:DNA methyltransferase [Microbacterium gorillae]|uniref:DNA methyltransferase n=1 Tax=Microbacterium gorillae TaxID=1231063 RepID=UPI003D9984BE